METTTLNVPSISCSICANKIKDGIHELRGIENVTVDLKSQGVKVEYNPSEIQPGDIKHMISSMGYEVIQ